MNPLLLALTVPLLAVAYRWRGGGFFATDHNWIVQLAWGLAVWLALAANGMVLSGWLAALLLVSVVASLRLSPPHSQFMNGLDLKSNFGMAGIGLIRGVMVFGWMGANPWALAVLAAGHGLAYRLGWSITRLRQPTGDIDGTPYSELLVGVAYALAIMVL